MKTTTFGRLAALAAAGAIAAAVPAAAFAHGKLESAVPATG
ncbi:copper resistance protein CopC, partial [Burkholderia territorii]